MMKNTNNTKQHFVKLMALLFMGLTFQTYQAMADTDCNVDSDCGPNGSCVWGGPNDSFCSHSSGPTPIDNSSFPPAAGPIDDLQNFLSSLEPFSPSSGLFGNIFGQNFVCIDRYESRKRVKTKAFNYNYFLVFHTGLKVKHQKKGWTGLWRRQNTDQVYAGVPKYQFQYNSHQVAPLDVNLNNNIISSAELGQSWSFNTQNQAWPYLGGLSPYNVSGQSPFDGSSPIRVFADDFVIRTYSDTSYTSPVLGSLDTLLVQGERNAISQMLNEYFWDRAPAIQSATRLLSGNSSFTLPYSRTLAYKSVFADKVLFQKSYLKKCANCSRVRKTIDAGFGVCLSHDTSGNNWQVNLGCGLLDRIKPKNLNVTMYGAALRNGQWHGSLIQTTLD